MVQPDKAARVFKVLSVESRVRLIELLKQRSLCVNALARSLAITPAAVSQHLRVLRDAEVVIADKQGYHVHYRINPDTLAQWARIAGSVLQADGVRERVARSLAGTDG
ncbi:MAG: metalloregulator ArsR/SmtB family transcription factor [Pseudodesulfovibrio sp.]|uniref:Regulatory protein ArsR n=1 Tax=Pseudodesulfovibrio aespoeensis (strain ATCC 700646 / DSM 10631 / Aspo-2) TaxID=643562 RepID=E6VTE1_PSEA9|nr:MULTISPECIES: metalloregulator ArsR/SmtB family transcription factor [Pseudodesulfovibrio]MBU4192822.1 metalloregulator ArsR/SmtB family transcription factor [Pseudomonadota bacterium]ADU62118.1 regulatory protein ArsR [Pseudodesulfovibrio aespoeensis Aspo-2]MBU4378810.1 metalloregulator ArsR/SmtB family transcription factor [Pseudomonadota bacterium]MBU4476564.1 metalloregulator ArsR/SmtB family transcription factor [Pseudomonadota bacterium]MBU4515911.1 metalloregulator ArsR/SmtB family t